MPASTTLTNLRAFPKKEAVPQGDAFWLRIGAKEMVTASTKKETEGAIATRWNQSVLGLAATVLILVSALVTVAWNYASLSADFRNYQKTTDEKIQKMEQKVDKVEDWQRQDSLQKARVDGFKLGAAETQATENSKEKK